MAGSRLESALPTWLPIGTWLIRFGDQGALSFLFTLAVAIISWVWDIAPRTLFRLAFVVSLIYLVLTVVVLGVTTNYLMTDGYHFVQHWWSHYQRPDMGAVGPANGVSWISMLTRGVGCFGVLALGLSGLELSLNASSFVAGDDREVVRRTRLILVISTMLMCVLIPLSVSVCSMLIDASQVAEGQSADDRALAYLAHGGMLKEHQSARAISSLFGPVFGTIYDLSTIAILCFAGAGVSLVMRDLVPNFLLKFGMELHWAHRIGVNLHLSNLIVMLVASVFKGNVAKLQGAYAACVLVLLTANTLAAALKRGEVERAHPRLPKISYWFLFATIVFLATAITSLLGNRLGIEIPLAFLLAIIVSSAVSRWLRSTELRLEELRFVDSAEQAEWNALCNEDLVLLVPHRPGIHSRDHKERDIRTNHRLGEEVPIIFLEATLGDTSNFMQNPIVHVAGNLNQTRLQSVSQGDRVKSPTRVIRIENCCSVSHAIAAVALELARNGKPPEIHFGWSFEPPLAANLNFLLFGQGNIPWMVQDLIRRSEPNPAKRPRVFIG